VCGILYTQHVTRGTWVICGVNMWDLIEGETVRCLSVGRGPFDRSSGPLSCRVQRFQLHEVDANGGFVERYTSTPRSMLFYVEIVSLAAAGLLVLSWFLLFFGKH
jgi:hypothetical protein